MRVATVGLDLAKRVFQVRGVDKRGKVRVTVKALPEDAHLNRHVHDRCDDAPVIVFLSLPRQTLHDEQR
jgi:hypothetical protein